VLGTYRSLEGATIPSGLTPIVLPSELDLSARPIHDAVAKLNLLNEIDVVVDCAGLDALLNDSLLTMSPKGSGRIIVMAASRLDGFTSVDFRTLYFKGLTIKGLNSGALGAADIKGVLDYVAKKYDEGIFMAGEVEMVPMEDEIAVKEALSRVLARSTTKRSVIIPHLLD